MEDDVKTEGGGKYRPAYRRMFRIDELLKSESYPSAAFLAKKIGVSKRTILRDLRYMEMELSAPLVYDREKNGYCYVWPDYTLSDFAFTDDDLQVLLLAERLLEEVFADSFYRTKVSGTFRAMLGRAGNMADMLRHTVREDIQIVLPDSGNFAQAETMLEAMRKRLCVTAKRGGGAELLLRPLRLVYVWGGWHLLYITEDYRDNRDFRLERLAGFSGIRLAKPLRSKEIRDVIENVGESRTPAHNRRPYTEADADGGEVLHLFFTGNSDEFHLMFRREADGSATFVETEDTMLGGHVLETVLGMVQDVRIEI